MHSLSKTLNHPPPPDFSTFGPSQLFRYFFQIGRWTEDSFSDDFQTYTRGKLISTVTISKWKNRDVVPTRYSGPLFKLIQDRFAPTVASDWIIAFETVWAKHLSRPISPKQSTRELSFADTVCRQHIDWIASQYKEDIFGESFSASDVYVPLQLIETTGDDFHIVEIEDLVDDFSKIEENDKVANWTFICGGPGSGKSMAAIHLAQNLSKTDVFPIYLRGSHLSDIEIDIQNGDQLVIDSFSAKSFLKNFRASSQKTACLILDGLDEIPLTNGSSTDSLNRFLTELSREQKVCQAHGKTLFVVALGRQSHVSFAVSKTRSMTERQLDMLSLDGSYTNSKHGLQILGKDLREDWWKNYLHANQWKLDPSLPDFLCTEFNDFSDFGSEPLLTYLICRLALKTGLKNHKTLLAHEIVNKLTYEKNRNDIYQNIIEHFHTHAPLKNGSSTDRNQTFAVLQHIALANWHQGSGNAVSLEAVQKIIHNPQVKSALKHLNMGSLTGHTQTPDMLLTAFYYRITTEQDAVSRQPVIEFTHRTFSEYLTSTLIWDRFEQLIRAFVQQTQFDDALTNWTAVSYTGEHDPTLGDFCQNEARLRYARLSDLDWDAALEILRQHLSVAQFEKGGLESLTQLQRSASLLLFIWSCMNIERHSRTGEGFNLFENEGTFTTYDLKRIQLPNGLDLETGSLTEPQLQHHTYLTNSLSALYLTGADLSQLSFSTGHMQAVTSRESNFSMTHWSHVKISRSTFKTSAFQQTMFHGCRWMDTNLHDCLFQGSKFQLVNFRDCNLSGSSFSQCHFSDVEFLATNFHNATFDRCTFSNCDFSNGLKERDLGIATFNRCTFLNMTKIRPRISLHNFKDCVFQSSH